VEEGIVVSEKTVMMSTAVKSLRRARCPAKARVQELQQAVEAPCTEAGTG
jgi:hypothetical protein